MDIKTLLEIIKVIEYRHDSILKKGYYSYDEKDVACLEFKALRDYLQEEYIEAQVSAMETSTGM